MRIITLLLTTLVFSINTSHACDSFFADSGAFTKQKAINKEQANDRLNQIQRIPI